MCVCHVGRMQYSREGPRRSSPAFACLAFLSCAPPNSRQERCMLNRSFLEEYSLPLAYARDSSYSFPHLNLRMRRKLSTLTDCGISPPAACRRCCPMGDNVGTVLVVNLLCMAPRTSAFPSMLALHRFGFRWGGERGLELNWSSRGETGPR